MRLRPGKRGKFALAIVEWWVFDPARHDTVHSGGLLPEKPWLECSATVVPFKKRTEHFTVTLFLSTHHAMQRLAERCNARTPFDLLEAVGELWRAIEREIEWEKAITDVLDGGKDVPLPRPKYVPVAGGKAVFDWAEEPGKGTLVVTTILDAEMVV